MNFEMLNQDIINNQWNFSSTYMEFQHERHEWNAVTGSERSSRERVEQPV